MIGTKLAHFTITAHLGSGGMGEVYQAADSKLGRSVAIKLLPEAFARDVDRAARFEREARVLASLNHPHIAAIYGIEEQNGQKFLVMELAGGETLAERIRRGPIPVDEALAIAMQIAEGLESAHEKGITHRDLKPANIKITPDGNVKVLDFGLAKAFEGEAVDGNLSNSPTMMSIAGTNAGMILGTAAYMSPEQAKGKDVDRRTDIFAFGAVLYEMLTGRQAFAGETVSDILSRVILAEPDWSRLPNATPTVVRRVLKRCLQKDRNLRLRDVSDARLEILEPRGEGETAAPQAKGRERLAWIAGLVAAVVVATTSSALVFRTPAVDAPETRVDIVTPATVDTASFDISPDGRKLVFVASADGGPRLWLRPLDSTTAQPLPGTENATYPFWSPDSKSVAFFAAGKLKRVDIGGGLPQILTDSGPGRGGAWSPAGVIIFGDTGGLFRVPASSGEIVAVTKVDPEQLTHRFPQFLPGGRQFLFYADGRADESGIYLGSLDSSEIRQLTAADTAGLYVSSGWLLYMRQGTLTARRFDPARGELKGDPVTVADAVAFNVPSRGKGAFAVSAEGMIAYRSASYGDRRQLTWFDRSGKTLGALGDPDENTLADAEISPDGRRVAVDRVVAGNPDIWILDAVRSTRFTFGASSDRLPVWSPDGSQIIFQSNSKGVFDLYRKRSSGAGSEELLLESTLSKFPNDWSPDGHFLLYYFTDPKTNPDLWVLPLEGGDRKPTVFLNGNFDERGARFSPDGRWVAYRSDESGRSEIYVRPFPQEGAQWQISTGGGIAPRWRADGKELYYIAPDSQLMAAPIGVQGDALQQGTPTVLFQTRIVLGGSNVGRAQYDVAPDGRFLINQGVEGGSTAPITLLQNWSPELKK